MPSLILIRHAIAEERGEAWPDDRERPLTSRGERRMRAVAEGLLSHGEAAELILTSPLVRARQTAGILRSVWSPTPTVAEVPSLAPGQSPRAMLDGIRPFGGQPRVAVVGHEPDLGELAAWLIGARLALPFKKGGAARIDIGTWPPTRGGTLVWFATPRMFRAGGDR